MTSSIWPTNYRGLTRSFSMPSSLQDLLVRKSFHSKEQTRPRPQYYIWGFLALVAFPSLHAFSAKQTTWILFSWAGSWGSASDTNTPSKSLCFDSPSKFRGATLPAPVNYPPHCETCGAFLRPIPTCKQMPMHLRYDSPFLVCTGSQQPSSSVATGRQIYI